MIRPARPWWAALPVVIALAACADMSRETWDVDRVRAMAPTGDAFRAALHRDYLEIAEEERSEGDWPDARYFLRRAEAVALGEAVAPQEVAEREIVPEKAPELEAARERLLALFKRRGLFGRAPAEAARAQTAYECWLQEQEEGHQPAEIENCRKAFEAAVKAAGGKLVGRSVLVVLPNPDGTFGKVTFDDGRGVSVLDAAQAAIRFDPDVDTSRARLASDELGSLFGRAIDAQPLPPRSFTLYFVKGKDRLTPESATEFAEVIDDARKRGAPEVFLTGHTDRRGRDRFNEKLSKKRADAVREGLVSIGVDPAAIVVEFKGENEPAVPTADNVDEPLNRRVEIFIR